MPDVKSSESCDSCFCVELAVDLPDSKRGINIFTENPEAFVVGQMKRKAVKVSERHLSLRPSVRQRGPQLHPVTLFQGFVA